LESREIDFHFFIIFYKMKTYFNMGENMEDISKFDQKIEDNERQINELRKKMEEICIDFIKEIKGFVVIWSKKEVENAIVSMPDKVKEYGEESLKKMKADLQNFLTKVPELVDKYIDNEELWVHRGQLPENINQKMFDYLDEKWHHPNKVKKTIKILFGYVGEILQKHGFLKEGREWRIGNIKEKPEYQYGYIMSEKMKSAFDHYEKMYYELMRFDNELKSTKRNKEEAKIRNLWEKI